MPIDEHVNRGRAPDEITDSVCAEFESVLRAHAGTRDDFFGLGGSSLSAAKLAIILTARFGKAIGLPDILRLRTPEAIAFFLRDAPDVQNLPVGQSHDSADAYALSPPQRWYSRAYSGPAASSGVITFAMELPAGTEPAEVRRVLAALAARHDALRTAVEPSGAVLVQRMLSEAAVAGEFLVLRAEGAGVFTERAIAGAAADLARAAATVQNDEQAIGIPLGHGPLFRAVLLRGTDPALSRPLQLVMTVHHLVFDGGSLPVFRDEFSTLLSGGGPPTATAPSYREYSSWRTREEEGSAQRAGEQRWRAYLDGVAAATHLPLRDRGGCPAGWSTTLTVPPATRQRCIETARALKSPVTAVRIAALFIACHALYHSDDVIVCMPTNGRDLPALENAIGMFVNFVPLRHRIQGQQSAQDLILTVSEDLLGAIENRHVSFDKISGYVAGGESPGRFPLSGVLFNGEAADRMLSSAQPSPDTLPMSRRMIFDFQAYFTDGPDRADLEIQHRADALTKAEGVRLLEAYVDLLAQVCCPPDLRVDDLIGIARQSLY
jgi:hypothetical protein